MLLLAPIYLVVYFLSSLTYAGTTQSVTWGILRQNMTVLPKYQSLLNRTLLGFLDDCPGSELCPTYYDIVSLVNKTNLIITAANISSEISKTVVISKGNVNEFCSNFGNEIPGTSDIKGRLQSPLMCAIICMDLNKEDFTLKPICKIILWLSHMLHSQHNPKNNEEPKPLSSRSDPVVKTSTTGSLNNSKPEEVSVLNQKKGDVQQDQSVASDNKQNKKDENAKNDLQILTTTEKIAQKSESEIPAKRPEEEETKADDNMHKTESAENSAVKGHPDPAIDYKDFKSNVDDKVGNANPSQAITTTVALKASKSDDATQNQVDEKSNIEEDNTVKKPDDDLVDSDINLGPDVDVMSQDRAKSDSFQDDYDDTIDEIRPPQASINEPEKDPTKEEVIGSKSSQFLQKPKSQTDNMTPHTDIFYEKAGSNFFTFFLVIMFSCIILYVLYHNRSKILALLLEGRKSHKGRNGRRKHTAQYRKLDSNLEEAITSSSSARGTQIIY